MSDRTISLKLSSELLQEAQAIAGDEDLHDFLVGAIKDKIQYHQQDCRQDNFWQGVEKLRDGMQEEGVEIDPLEIWGDVRSSETGKEIILP